MTERPDTVTKVPPVSAAAGTRLPWRWIAVGVYVSVVAFWVVYQVVGVFLYVFGWIFILTRGGPGYASTTLDFDVYQNAFTNGLFGYASAQSVCLLVIAAIVVIVGFPLARKAERT